MKGLRDDLCKLMEVNKIIYGFSCGRGHYIKPRLNDQTFPSNIVFVAHNMGWLTKHTVFDQTSNKVSPHNAFCVLPLQVCSNVTQIGFLIGCFSPLGFALFAEAAKRSNICS